MGKGFGVRSNSISGVTAACCAGITGTVTWHPYRQAGKWQVNSGMGKERDCMGDSGKQGAGASVETGVEAKPGDVL